MEYSSFGDISHIFQSLDFLFFDFFLYLVMGVGSELRETFLSLLRCSLRLCDLTFVDDFLFCRIFVGKLFLSELARLLLPFDNSFSFLSFLLFRFSALRAGISSFFSSLFRFFLSDICFCLSFSVPSLFDFLFLLWLRDLRELFRFLDLFDSVFVLVDSCFFLVFEECLRTSLFVSCCDRLECIFSFL